MDCVGYRIIISMASGTESPLEWPLNVLCGVGLPLVNVLKTRNILFTFSNKEPEIFFMQTWNGELNDSSRASSYILFAKFDFQLYLDNIQNINHRNALSRLRVSSHRLQIEMGRWHKPNVIPRNERKCQLCNTLEDEFHFLLECPLYFELRKTYINRYFWHNPNIPKYIELLTSENINIIRRLSCFVYKGFTIRQNTYYN